MAALSSESLKVGARLRYWSGLKEGPGTIGEVKYDGVYELADGTAVVYIRGVGAVALSHVEPLDLRGKDGAEPLPFRPASPSPGRRRRRADRIIPGGRPLGRIE